MKQEQIVALENIEKMIKSYSKEEILSKLKRLSEQNQGGPKISEILNGCKDQMPYFELNTEKEIINKVTFSIFFDYVDTIVIKDTSQNYEIINTKSTHTENVGFLLHLLYNVRTTNN
jgi:hypothetical protein